MIAVVELPRGCWPGLITTLVGNVTNPASTEIMKESTLQALGYVCQDVEHRLIVDTVQSDIGYLRGFIYQVSGGGRKRDLDRDRARDAEGRDE